MNQKERVAQIIMAVKFEHIRTKNDLKICGCKDCLKALKILERK